MSGVARKQPYKTEKQREIISGKQSAGRKSFNMVIKNKNCEYSFQV